MATNLVTLTNPSSPAAEAYRRLRVNLTSAGREAALHTLLVGRGRGRCGQGCHGREPGRTFARSASA